MRRAAIGLVMILSACTGAVETTTVPPTEPTSVTTAPPNTTVTTGDTLPMVETTTTTATTSPPVEPVPVESFGSLPTLEGEGQHIIDHWASGGPGLVYTGYVSPTDRDHPNEGAIWHVTGATSTRTLLSDVTSPDEWGFSPDISTIVYWAGRYLAFLEGDMSAPEMTASMLSSVDGRSWKLEHLPPSRSAAGSIGRFFATPESPPWPGSAGIANAITTDREVIAVGWVTTSEGSTAALWRSDDGRNWTLTTLPNSLWPNEWANTVSVGESGWLIAGAGPVHSNSLLWFSPVGSEWTFIGDQFGADAWWSFGEVASGADGLAVAAWDMNQGAGATSWYSDDGLAWTQSDEELGQSPDGPVRLASDGKVIARLQADSDIATIETSTDGHTWRPVTSLTLAHEHPDIFTTWFDLTYLGDTLTVSRYATPEDYSIAPVDIWIDAASAGVVLVEEDDTLNVREGVMTTIIGELDPNATGVQMTGRSDGAAGSLWVEILHEGRLGWVNSSYLSEEITDFEAHDPLTTLNEFADQVFRSSGHLGPHVGPKGVSVVHHDDVKSFSINDDPMSDPTIYLWGGTGCGTDPECAYRATFADQIATPFLADWEDEDRVVLVDTPIAGGNGTLPEAVVPVPFRNFHYLAIHDAGDNPTYSGMDWSTWYVYFDLVDDELKVVAISLDTWAP